MAQFWSQETIEAFSSWVQCLPHALWHNVAEMPCDIFEHFTTLPSNCEAFSVIEAEVSLTHTLERFTVVPLYFFFVMIDLMIVLFDISCIDLTLLHLKRSN